MAIATCDRPHASLLPCRHGVWLWLLQRCPRWEATYAQASSIDVSASPDPTSNHSPPTIDHPQRLSVRDATSTATIRVPVDHPTVDHRERRRHRRSEIAADPFQIFCTKKITRFVATALIWNLA